MARDRQIRKVSYGYGTLCSVLSRYRVAAISAGLYLGFCSLIFTPLDDLVLYWPYPLLIATQSFTGLSTAAAFDYLAADALGLCVVLCSSIILQRVVGPGRPSWPGTLVLGAISWIVSLAVLQLVVWILFARILGGRNL